MKTNNISNSILNNFHKLSSLAETNITKVDKNYKPIWGLKYKHNGVEGFVSELGVIERRKARMLISNGKLEKIKKTFFLDLGKNFGKI